MPLLIVAPGRLAPQRLDTPVRTVDIAPTVLGLVGAPVPSDLDGIDLAQLIELVRLIMDLIKLLSGDG